MLANQALVSASTSEPPPGAEHPARRPRYWRALVGSALLVVAFGWSLHRGALPVLPDRQALAGTSVVGVAGFAVLFSLSSLIRALKWWWLLAPLGDVPVRRVVRVSLIGYAALFVLPFRMGEFVRPLMIRRTGISAWAAVGTVGAERVVDGLTVTVLLALGLWLSVPLSPLPDHIGSLPVSAALVPRIAFTAIVAFTAAFAALFLFYFQRRFAQRMLELTLGRLSPRLASWVVGRIGLLADGLGFLGRPTHSVPFVGLTILYWVLFGASNWVLLSACGIEGVSAAEVGVVIGVFSLAILLPNAPGFFGAFQVSLYAALSMYIPGDIVLSEGSAFVFLNFVGQIALTLALGVIGWLGERRAVDLAPAPAESGGGG